DPQKTTYRQILEFFFQIHDPTTLNRQGNDRGLSYRSAIFYVDAEQRRVAQDTIADVEASGLWPGAVGTEVRPARFGRRSPNTRTISSTSRTATPVISYAPTGYCPAGAAASRPLPLPSSVRNQLSGPPLGTSHGVSRHTVPPARLGPRSVGPQRGGGLWCCIEP